MADRYVDFGAANDGNGTSYVQAGSPGGVGAYNTLVGKTFDSGDVVWCRRSSTALAASADAITGVSYVGWPKEGDQFYGSRPTGPRVSWDADTDDYCKFSGASSTFNSLTFSNVSNVNVHRFEFVHDSADSWMVFSTCSNLNMHNIKISSASSSNLSSVCISMSTVLASTFQNWIIDVPNRDLDPNDRILFVNTLNDGNYFNNWTITLRDLGGILIDVGSNSRFNRLRNFAVSYNGSTSGVLVGGLGNRGELDIVVNANDPADGSHLIETDSYSITRVRAGLNSPRCRTSLTNNDYVVELDGMVITGTDGISTSGIASKNNVFLIKNCTFDTTSNDFNISTGNHNIAYSYNNTASGNGNNISSLNTLYTPVQDPSDGFWHWHNTQGL